MDFAYIVTEYDIHGGQVATRSGDTSADWDLTGVDTTNAGRVAEAIAGQWRPTTATAVRWTVRVSSVWGPIDEAKSEGQAGQQHQETPLHPRVLGEQLAPVAGQLHRLTEPLTNVPSPSPGLELARLTGEIAIQTTTVLKATGYPAGPQLRSLRALAAQLADAADAAFQQESPRQHG